MCYDNEGYMNTGTQRSSASPAGAVTSTTPVLAKLQHKKDMIGIVEAHRIPYVATASPAFPLDLFDKVRTAKDIRGSRYIEVHAPCPPGWGFPNKDLIKMGKLAVETGTRVLYGNPRRKIPTHVPLLALAKKGRKKTVADYVKGQTRFKTITEEQVRRLQEYTDLRWEEFLERHARDDG